MTTNADLGTHVLPHKFVPNKARKSSPWCWYPNCNRAFLGPIHLPPNDGSVSS